MKLSYRIALRYIFARKSFHFISVITMISIIGIIVGVAALISVISIFNGFSEFAESQMIGFDPHIRISAKNGSRIENADSLLPKIRKISHVEHAMSVSSGKVISMKNTIMQVVFINAVQEEELKASSSVADSLAMGVLQLKNPYSMPGIFIGSGVKEKLDVYIGDTLTLVSPEMIEKSIKSHRQNAGVKVVVTGVFHTNIREYDEYYCYCDTDIGRYLFSQPIGAASSVDIRADKIDNVDRIKNELSELFPEQFLIQTWYDLHRDLYNIMKFERFATFIVLSLIIIIAVFNVLASLSMTVIEKRADIAVLKTMGADSKFIQSVYLSEGIIIGIISTFLGTALGLAFCYGQIYFSWFELDQSKYLIPAIPVSIHLADILFITGFSLLLSFVATMYPAKRAAGTNIVQSINQE